MVAPNARTLTAHCIGCGTTVAYVVGRPVACKCKRPGQWRVSPLGLRPVPQDLAAALAASPAPTVPTKRPGYAAETLLYAELVKAGYLDLGLTPPRLEVPEGVIVNLDGAFVRQWPWGAYLEPRRAFCSDAAFLVRRVLVECDGGAHAATKRQWRSDTERRGLAAAAGWIVAVFTPDQIPTGKAIDMVGQALASRRTS